MIELEIRGISALPPAEATLLDHHSLLNVLNVLHGELSLLGLMLEDNAGCLAGSLASCDTFIAALRDPDRARGAIANLVAEEARIVAEVEVLLARHPARRQEPAVAESVQNLKNVLQILRVRADELRARADQPRRWLPFPVESLRTSFLEVFAAIEAHSHGRFRIIYNFARQEPRDYYVDLKFETADGGPVWMPPVLLDVMRDLIANARKYTAPGGHIIASLFEDNRELRFAVQDTGRGIPEEEIPRVVEFGHRGSNVGDVRTLGGGFGLTKAFLVTRQFGGRFWIASRLDVGTRIRLVLPRPADAGEKA